MMFEGVSSPFSHDPDPSRWRRVDVPSRRPQPARVPKTGGGCDVPFRRPVHRRRRVAGRTGRRPGPPARRTARRRTRSDRLATAATARSKPSWPSTPTATTATCCSVVTASPSRPDWPMRCVRMTLPRRLCYGGSPRRFSEGRRGRSCWSTTFSIGTVRWAPSPWLQDRPPRRPWRGGRQWFRLGRAHRQASCAPAGGSCKGGSVAATGITADRRNARRDGPASDPRGVRGGPPTGSEGHEVRSFADRRGREADGGPSGVRDPGGGEVLAQPEEERGGVPPEPARWSTS